MGEGSAKKVTGLASLRQHSQFSRSPVSFSNSLHGVVRRIEGMLKRHRDHRPWMPEVALRPTAKVPPALVPRRTLIANVAPHGTFEYLVRRMRTATAVLTGIYCLLATAHFSAGQAASPQQTVCGKVQKVTCDSKAPHVTTLELKPKSKMPVTILPASRTQFIPRPEERYRDTEICATGLVDISGRQRRLVVSRPQDISIRKQLKPPVRPWTGPYAAECDEGVEMPMLIHEVKPSYTWAAMEAEIVGIVALEAIVDTDGTVGEIRVRRSLDSKRGLDDEAVRAVRQWRFKPGTRLDAPVPVLVQIEVSFRLK
jgi:TonB family protein